MPLETSQTNVPTLPRVKPIEQMNKYEYEAFLSGIWDGIDRRNPNHNSKEHIRAARQKGRRRTDIEMKWVHYITQIILFIILAASYYMAFQGWGS